MKDPNLADTISFGNDGETFNGSLHVKSIILTRDTEDPAHTIGNWRYRVQVPADEALGNEFISTSYATPKAAIAALDSQLRPWINPWIWVVGVAVIIYFVHHTAWDSGNRDGIHDGVRYEFESLCGFSSAREIKRLNQEIPDHTSEVPVAVQRYCLDKLVEEAFINPGE